MDKNSLLDLTHNFNKRNIEVKFFETLDSVKSYILELIPLNSTVGIGHSTTLEKISLTSSLIEKGYTVYDKELSKDKIEGTSIKKKALTSDWYITGSNAISIDGRIVNVDHSGNRVSAISFGPDKVIIVVGKNKIVDTLENAIKRVKNISCPLNAKRAGYNPPCVELNKCVDCTSKERVCNILSIVEGQIDKNRISLFIVNEESGF
ncbi:lactate utilization protein [Clostridium hydrogeniformans]|uniref:lactate utilization protein n=1 Tax=Clostridium hydrogeniformans TaxID=349933 RepID=UPI000485831C|nr:lactate utilization protein [Clostridium hydrogeniformans]